MASAESSQIWVETVKLFYRPPPPSLLQKASTLPLPLVPLRDTVLSAWPTSQTPSELLRTEPLVHYIAALAVAMRKRPEWKSALHAEQAQCLEALFHVYDRLAQQASSLAGKEQFSLAALKARQLTQRPQDDLSVVYDAQCQCLRQWANQAENASTLDTVCQELAHVYEKRLPIVQESKAVAYLKAEIAHWRAAALMLSAPKPVLPADELRFSASHVREQKMLRHRHYQAAHAAMEEAGRLVQSLDQVEKPFRQAFDARAKRVAEESLRARQELSLYDANTGYYVSHDPAAEATTTTTTSSLLTLPLLPLSQGANGANGGREGEDLFSWQERHALEETLLREMDSWSMSEAAHSLTNVGTPPNLTYSLPVIMARVLGQEQRQDIGLLVNLKTKQHLWRPALIAALTERLGHMQEGRFGGIDRKKHMEEIKAVRDKLLMT